MTFIDYWQAALMLEACISPLFIGMLWECTVRMFVSRDGGDSYWPED